MPDDLLTYIRKHRDTLTRAGRQIADFILAHSDEAVHMPISQIARECDVGESTIHRFCQCIGRTGYMDMRLALASCIRDRSHTSITHDAEGGAVSPYGAIALRLSECMRGALHQTHSLLDSTMLVETARRVSEAKRIVLYGDGRGMSIAMHAYQRLMRLVSKALYPQTEEMQVITASYLGRDDVAMFFPAGEPSQRVMSLAELCAKSGAFLVSFADDVRSPLADICDQSYLCPGLDDPSRESRFSRCCVQAYLIEVLCMIYETEYPLPALREL